MKLFKNLKKASTRELITFLIHHGWFEVKGNKHRAFKHPTNPNKLLIPQNRQQNTLPKGTVHSILKDAGLLMPY